MADGGLCGEEATITDDLVLLSVNRLTEDIIKSVSCTKCKIIVPKSNDINKVMNINIEDRTGDCILHRDAEFNSRVSSHSSSSCLVEDNNIIVKNNNKNNTNERVYDFDRYDDDEDEDDDDDDEDEDDDDEDEDGDDEDEVSSSSIISGCVSDGDVLIGIVTKPKTIDNINTNTTSVEKKDETVIVEMLKKQKQKHVKIVSEDRTASSLLGEINTVVADEEAIMHRGLITAEPCGKRVHGPGVEGGVATATVQVNNKTIIDMNEDDEKIESSVTVNNNNNNNNNNHNNNFKGQIRSAEDTLVGPCGKKRCVDRYDSSESSDSGVAVSCGECSSSGTSDITEPGSPCSTSSDEGVAGIRSSAPSPPHKLAPPTPPPTRGPQWPWTPPLAATACSTLKKIKGEPEAGTLPKAGAADPTNCRGKSHHHQHHHQHDPSNAGIPSTQGKITEYFKTQIKPQQVKVKKSLDMSLLVAKSSPEFRRPPTVQRNKVGLAKYLGTVPPHSRPNDWEVRTLTMSPPPMKKLPVVVPRTQHGKIDKLQSPVPSLPISTNVLNSLPAVKLSSLRLPTDVSPDPKIVAPSSPAIPSLAEDTAGAHFDDDLFAKPAVNENNNLTSTIILPNRSLQNDHISRLSPVPDPAIVQVDQEPKQPLSPILSAPTTIRFPAQAPGKNRPQTTDSGICRWDQCDSRFDSSSGLLEHLQVSHINTQTGGDNFICHWQGCKVQGRTSCSRRWLERHVLSHGGNKPFRCIVDGCGSRFSSQITLERHVNGHFNQPETSSSSSRKSCENGGKLVRRNGKRLRYRRQPWSARLFDFIDTGVMEGLQHRLLELAKSRTQGRLADTPGDAMALTSQVLARRVEHDGKTRVLLRWYPQDIAPDEWVLESEVQEMKHVRICNAAASSPDQVNLALYPAMNGGSPPQTRTKQRRKPIKNS